MDSSVAALAALSLDENKTQPFRFFDLPSELRLRIYEFVLLGRNGDGQTIDLDPYNFRTLVPRMSCFLVCRQMHSEAYPVFYGSPQQPFLLFPKAEGKFFNTKKPLISRIGPKYRGTLNTIELRLGPGWSKVPKCWNTNPTLGLTDCVSLRTLKLFVQLDPSASYLDGFRGSHDKNAYKNMCVALLHGIIEQVPSLDLIEVDAWSDIPKSSPLIQALIAEAMRANKRLTWGPHQKKAEGMISSWNHLETAMASLMV